MSSLFEMLDNEFDEYIARMYGSSIDSLVGNVRQPALYPEPKYSANGLLLY